MAIEFLWNEEIFGEGGMEREKESVLPSVGEGRIGRGAYTLKNQSEELFRKMLTPT